MTAPLSSLLDPKSIAIVGASPTPTRVGGIPIVSMREQGFPLDKLLLINPKYQEIDGIPCYPDIASLPWTPELVVLAVSAKDSVALVKQAHEKGIKAAVLFASGFAEEGTPEGKALQQELVDFAAETGMRIGGPNGLGHGNFHDHSFPSFLSSGHIKRPPGPISIISQSGNFVATLLRGCADAGLGFRYVVSAGNEAVIDFCDYLEHFAADPKTELVVGYVEQIRNGPRFLKAAAALRDAGKPLFLLKGGRSAKGGEATASHTGAMAGSSEVYDAVFRQLNIYSADEPQRLADLVRLWAKRRKVGGDRAGVVSLSGAGCVVLADMCEDAGLDLPGFSEATKAGLRKWIPSYGMITNPVDLTGQIANAPEAGPEVFKTLADSGEVDAIFVYITGSYMKQLAPGIAAAAKQQNCLLVAIDSADEVTDYHTMMEEAGAPVFLDISRAVAATRTFLQNGERLRTEAWRPYDKPVPQPAADAQSVVLSEAQSKAWLTEAGLPSIPEGAFPTADAAAKFANGIGYPVVVKVNSPDIAHKTEVGGVKLNIEDEAGVREAFEAVTSSARAAKPAARIDGVVVQKQIRGGQPVLVGIVRDPNFGPVLTVGYGGVLTELYKDISLRVLPVDAATATVMLKELKSFPLLDGFRGAAPADVPALARFIEALSSFYMDNAAVLEEVEINPVMVLDRGKGVAPVDALIRKRG